MVKSSAQFVNLKVPEHRQGAAPVGQGVRKSQETHQNSTAPAALGQHLGASYFFLDVLNRGFTIMIQNQQGEVRSNS